MKLIVNILLFSLLVGCAANQKKQTASDSQFKTPYALNEYVQDWFKGKNKAPLKALDINGFKDRLREAAANNNEIIVEIDKESLASIRNVYEKLINQYRSYMGSGDQGCAIIWVERKNEHFLTQYECYDNGYIYVDMLYKEVASNFEIIDFRFSSNGSNWMSEDAVSTLIFIKANPKHMALVTSLIQSGQKGKAYRAWHELDNKVKIHAPLLLYTILTTQDKKALKELVALAEKHYPNDPTFSLHLIDYYDEINNKKKLWESINNLLNEYPNAYMMHALASKYYLSEKIYVEALNHIRQVILIKPQLDIGFKLLLDYSGAIKDKELALKTARTCVHSFGLLRNELTNEYTRKFISDDNFWLEVSNKTLVAKD